MSLQARAHFIAGNERQAACGMIREDGALEVRMRLREHHKNWKSDGVARWSLSSHGCIWCRSTSVCLVHCSPIKRAATAEIMRPGLLAYLAGGGIGSFTTVGLKVPQFRHDLAAMVEMMSGKGGIFEALRQYRPARGERAYDNWRNEFGVDAWFRAMEVTYSHVHGWNLHFHFLFLLKRLIDPRRLIGDCLDVDRFEGRISGNRKGDVMTDDPAGWSFVNMWCNAADRWGKAHGIDGEMVTRYLDVDLGEAPPSERSYAPSVEKELASMTDAEREAHFADNLMLGLLKERPQRISGPNHSRLMDSGEVADYLAKVGSWDVVADTTSVAKRTRGDGLSPMGMLLGASGQTPFTVGKDNYRQRKLNDLRRFADWNTKEGQKRYLALYVEYLKVFHGRHVLAPSRKSANSEGFWKVLKTSIEDLRMIDSLLLVDEGLGAFNGEILDDQLLAEIPASIGNTKEAREIWYTAVIELRTVLEQNDGQLTAAVNKAIDQFLRDVSPLDLDAAGGPAGE